MYYQIGVYTGLLGAA